VKNKNNTHYQSKDSYRLGISILILLGFIIFNSLFTQLIIGEGFQQPLNLIKDKSLGSEIDVSNSKGSIYPVLDNFNHSPLSSKIDFNNISTFPGFIENRGQFQNTSVYYYFITENFGIYFARSEIFMTIKVNQPRSDNEKPECDKLQIWKSVKLKFLNANQVVPVGIGETDYRSNFFYGHGQFSDVPSWNVIEYRNIYEGISLRYFSVNNSLKYEFIVEPFADPNLINVKVVGDVELETNDDACTLVYRDLTISDLVIFKDTDLVGYQNERVVDSIRFHLEMDGEKSYTFWIGDYNRSCYLIIDPVILDYSTFLGGSSIDEAKGIAVDSNGCVYVTGFVASSDFPTYQTYDSSYHGMRWETA
jgi:hypothetical protein